MFGLSFSFWVLSVLSKNWSCGACRWRVCYSQGLPRLVSQHVVYQQVYSCCCSVKWLSGSLRSKNTPVGSSEAEKIAESVLLYVLWIAVPTSPFDLFMPFGRWHIYIYLLKFILRGIWQMKPDMWHFTSDMWNLVNQKSYVHQAARFSEEDQHTTDGHGNF